METTKQPIQRQIAKKLWLSSLDEGTFHKGSRNGDYCELFRDGGK